MKFSCSLVFTSPALLALVSSRVDLATELTKRVPLLPLIHSLWLAGVPDFRASISTREEEDEGNATEGS